MMAALDHPGPALIHLYAPNPRRHGFASDATLQRADLGVDGRVHPLVRYDPAVEGGLNQRLSLQDNRAPEQPWAADGEGEPVTPAAWAAGESRFAGEFSPTDGSDCIPVRVWLDQTRESRRSRRPYVRGLDGTPLAVGEVVVAAIEERREHWRTLQELGGLAGPLAEAARVRVEQELGDAHQAELEALKADYEAKLAELDKTQLASQATRLRDRLLQLAGYDASSAQRAESEKEPR
jgi:hypothetical protein